MPPARRGTGPPPWVGRVASPRGDRPPPRGRGTREYAPLPRPRAAHRNRDPTWRPCCLRVPKTGSPPIGARRLRPASSAGGSVGRPRPGAMLLPRARAAPASRSVLANAAPPAPLNGVPALGH